jgi:hypothetical protein
LLRAIRTPCKPIALVKLEPFFQKLLLLWYFGYAGLRNLERRFGGG